MKNKALSIADLVTSRDIDILAMTETWLGTSADAQVISELVPPKGYIYTIWTDKNQVILCLIYRPPPFTKNGFSITNFFNEWSAYLDYITTVPDEIIITGNLNFQLNPTNINVRRLSGQLDCHGLIQHVTGVTHMWPHPGCGYHTWCQLHQPSIVDPC